MQLNRALAVVLRHFYLMRGSFSRVMPLFVWVAIDIIFWGFLTRYLGKINPGEFSFVPAMLGAILLWDFFIRIMQGVTLAFFEDVWSRNFLNIFATPLSISEYITGLVLSTIATSSVGLAVMLLLATMVFGLSFASYGVMLAPFLFLLFLFGIALGIFACGIVLRFGPAAEWFIWPIPAMIAPFVGVVYPVSVLPEWMQYTSHIFPPAYVFEGVRSIVAGGTVTWDSIIIGLALDVVYILIACFFFSRVYKHAVRSGLIARYSAETVA